MTPEFLSALGGSGKRRKVAEVPEVVEQTPEPLPLPVKTPQEELRDDLSALHGLVLKMVEFKSDEEITHILRMRLHTEMRKWGAKEIIRLALELTAIARESEGQ